MDITAATAAQLITELLSRPEFDGAAITADLSGARDHVTAVQFGSRIAGYSRQAELLTQARERLERP